MIEVDLTIDGESAFEYESNSAPQVGEFLNIQHEHTNGIFKVMKVTHRIVYLRRKDRIAQYLVVEAETITS